MDDQVPVRGAAKPPAGATKEAELEKMLRKQEEEMKQQQQQAGVRELFILFENCISPTSSFHCVRQVSFESTCASLSREDSVSLS